ncbi:MAG TPA: preprotein translocase subunit SecG [Alphaproteobacteria bacterium]|nr:preprotein translocase subunit SecG [Alphaproteobacteria bacterium]
MYISLLTVAHIVLAILLILVVLLQRSESSMGALGGSNAVFTGKSVSGILTKATTIIAVLFMATSLMVVRESYKTKAQESVVEAIQTQTETPVEEQEPALPTK